MGLEQRNKCKYDILDAICNGSKSTIDNNNNNNNNNDNDNNDDNNNNNNNNSKYDANNANNSDDTNNKFNNGNSNDKNDQNKDDINNKNVEIDSFILGTAVNNILNSMSFYNKPVKEVLGNYEVDHEVECSQLSENSPNKQNIPFNSKYIKSESNVADIIIKVGPCKVNKFELEPESGKCERRAIVKFKEENNLL